MPGKRLTVDTCPWQFYGPVGTLPDVPPPIAGVGVDGGEAGSDGVVFGMFDEASNMF